MITCWHRIINILLHRWIVYYGPSSSIGLVTELIRSARAPFILCRAIFLPSVSIFFHPSSFRSFLLHPLTEAKLYSTTTTEAAFSQMTRVKASTGAFIRTSTTRSSRSKRRGVDNRMKNGGVLLYCTSSCRVGLVLWVFSGEHRIVLILCWQKPTTNM